MNKHESIKVAAESYSAVSQSEAAARSNPEEEKMVITITSLELKHWWNFFKLSLWGLKILRQTKTQKGFVRMKNASTLR